MIMVNRVTEEETEFILSGELGQLLLESISIVEKLRPHIIANVENSADVIYTWVDGLIDAAYGKL